MPVSLALALTLTSAAAGAVLLIAAALSALGPLDLSSARPTVDQVLEVVKLSLAVVAGVGGVVALVVAYRKQRVTEAGETREQTKLYAERFDKASDKLGSDSAAVRLAGVHALAALADDWSGGRQMCIDVLCAYLRMPPPAEPAPDADPDVRANRQAMGEVRATIWRLITTHLRRDAPTPWHGADLDFTGVTITTDVDFSDTVFPAGQVSFDNAKFSGGRVKFIDAEFSGGRVTFSRSAFSGGTVWFVSAEFSGGYVGFPGAVFSGGTVEFSGAEFSAGIVWFTEAVFSGGRVGFSGAEFSGREVDFSIAVFSGGELEFGGAKFTGGTVGFTKSKFTGGTVGFTKSKFTGGTVRFTNAKFTGGELEFGGAEFSGGTVDFDGAVFSGGRLRFKDVAVWSQPPIGLSAGTPGVELPVAAAALSRLSGNDVPTTL